MKIAGLSGTRGCPSPDGLSPVLILANPTSGGYRPKVLAEIRDRLREAGRTAILRATRHAGEIGEICSDPSLNADTVVIAGGDGSVNEALTGFREHPSPPKLAVIPCGTANVLALEMKLPHDPEAIAQMIAKGRTRDLHFGLANGHPFVLMASAGFDAEVVHALPLALKRRLGKLAYVFTALRIGFRRKGVPLTVTIDGTDHTAKYAIATNARHYGGPFVICPHTDASEGDLYMLLIGRDDPWATFLLGVALLCGRVHKTRAAKLIPFKKVRISASCPAAAQVDGDPFGVTPLEVESTGQYIRLIAT